MGEEKFTRSESKSPQPTGEEGPGPAPEEAELCSRIARRKLDNDISFLACSSLQYQFFVVFMFCPSDLVFDVNHNVNSFSSPEIWFGFIQDLDHSFTNSK